MLAIVVVVVVVMAVEVMAPVAPLDRDMVVMEVVAEEVV